MRSKRPALGFLALGLALALTAALVYRAGGQPRGKEEEPKSVPEAIAAAPKAVAECERLGRVLLTGLSDEKRSAKERAECAVALGKLRYVPAIPKLIELIKLQAEGDPDILKAEENRDLPVRATDAEGSRLLDLYPCIRALVDYGELAVPPVITAYLAKDDRSRGYRHGLACVLLLGKKKVSLVFLQGLLLERPDWSSKLMLLALVSELQQREKKD